MNTYEKKYKEALQKIRELIEKGKENGWTIITYEKDFEEIFPELKSEDERIREEIISIVKSYRESCITEGNHRFEDCIAWLEKQGEQESDPREENLEELLAADDIYQMAMNDDMVQEAKTKAINALSELQIGKLLGLENQDEQKPQGKSALEAATEEKVDNQNCVKPANNLEPKFHEGEWITNDDYTWKIVEVKPLDYILQSQTGNIVDDTISHVDEQFHSFTIKDAKKGDDCFEPIEDSEQQPADKAKTEHLIPQKGMYYTCIKDYYSSDHTHLCVKGNIYKSSFNGYIDDESHFGLSWTNSCTEKYFEPTKDEDWIVCEHDNVIGKPIQYKEFKEKVNQKFIENLKAQGITPKLRLWAIADAKDGDVLAAHECLVLFKEIDGLNIRCYCTYHYMGFNPSFHINTLQNKTAFQPATKEQRDTLEKAITNAGYRWDKEKLKLEKV